MDSEYYDVVIKFTCEVELTDQNGKVFSLSHSGEIQMAMDEEELEETNDSDYFPEILKSTIEYISDTDNDGEPFNQSKNLKFSVTEFEVIISQ